MSETLQHELNAIRESAAIAPLNDKENSGYPARAFLRITGSDATRWLNGMVTNNIKDLQPGEGNYNFLLNAQGRIQGDCTIYREPTDGPATFLLETQNSQLETVKQTLDHFIIMDDVELTPARMYGIVIKGHRAIETLDRCSDQLTSSFFTAKRSEPSPLFGHIYSSDMAWGKLEDQKAWILAPPSKANSFYEVWSPVDFDIVRLHSRLLELGAIEVSPETLEAFRIYSGTPKYGIDIRDRDLPQETAQTHALHFAKGCYLGQEIVERIRSRGNVHRTFTKFTLTGTIPTELPAPLEANAKPAGEITSATQIGDTIYALGYARREALDTHATLSYQGGTAVPLIPNP
jgi:folate-binding protein YgfZ